MSRYCEVQGIRIGEGQPKICVPLMGKNLEELRKQSAIIMRSPADLVEWRADAFDFLKNEAAVSVALEKLQEFLPERPLLFTVRTKDEGGEQVMSAEEYTAICRNAISSGRIALIDFELRFGETLLEPLMALAAEHDVKVILSSHDFQKTPPTEELLEKYHEMQALGADIAKLAVMPQSREDVLRLLSVSAAVSGKPESIPFIGISMGNTGLISRLAGEAFGSAVTFAAVGKSSAPGQMDADELDRMLTVMHRQACGQAAGERKLRKESADNIVLIGFMGTGKTTVGEKLTEKTGKTFAEIDEMVEAAEGRTIAEIFAQDGEAYFRDAETAVVRSVTQNSGTVISCGGGTVLREKNLELLRRRGTIFLLRATAETVFERVRKTPDKRPLLRTYMSRGYISRMMKKRSDIYEAAADYVIDVDGKSSEAIAEEILHYMNIETK